MKNMKNYILALLVLSEKKFNDDLGMSLKWLQTLATAPQPRPGQISVYKHVSL
jgi:hypothetical protein